MYKKNVKKTFEILRSEITLLMDLYVQFQYLTFQPDTEVRGVCKVKVFASVLVYTSLPLI